MIMKKKLKKMKKKKKSTQDSGVLYYLIMECKFVPKQFFAGVLVLLELMYV